MKKLLLLPLLFITVISFGQVPNYVPTNGLVGYWPFSGDATDASGNGNDGTNNGATLTTDRFGDANSAYYFSGAGCATRIDANVNTSSINGELTFSIWVLRSGSGCINPVRYFEAWPGSDAVSHLQLRWDESLAYQQGFTHRVAVNSGGNDYGPTGLTTSGFSPVPNDVWTQIVYVNDGVNAYLYQDGILRSTGTNQSGSSIQLASDVAFGRMNHPAYNALNGKIDDVGIWNRALDSVEVQQLYTGIMAQDTCFYTDTTFVTIYDTTYVTAYDTITYYDTVLVSVTDTLIIDVSLTGVTPPNNTNTILVYPNPSNDIVIIDNGDYLSMSGYTLKIINSLGQEVFNSIINIPQFQIPVSVLGSVGLYYIQVFDDNSSLLETKKLILN